MAATPEISSPEPKIVNGWKEIAGHLGRSVRTVQRYESELGLPVRRSRLMSSGSVIATTAELDAWVYARPLRKPFILCGGQSNEGPALADLKKTLLEHRRLREEMSGLRGEVHVGFLSLRAQLSAFRASDSGRSTPTIPPKADAVVVPRLVTKAAEQPENEQRDFRANCLLHLQIAKQQSTRARHMTDNAQQMSQRAAWMRKKSSPILP